MFRFLQVQWFKEGILVENNPDYQTSMEKGICRLTIEETFSEDTAKFICRAINPAGVAETQSQLVVKGNFILLFCVTFFNFKTKFFKNQCIQFI